MYLGGACPRPRNALAGTSFLFWPPILFWVLVVLFCMPFILLWVADFLFMPFWVPWVVCVDWVLWVLLPFFALRAIVIYSFRS